MEEIWKDIKGYEGRYMVSNYGNVKSLGNNKNRKEKILKPGVASNGYLQVYLRKDGKSKSFLVHRLVLMIFKPIENMENLEVNHINENKTNNRLDNLEWCDRKYNMNYGTRTQRANQSNFIPIVQLDVTTNEVVKVWESATKAEEKGGFRRGGIGACCRGERKTHKGYKWMYLEDYNSRCINS